MDIKINYIEKGTGSPLILLHGNGESHEAFKNQTAPFSEHFRVIAPDTRGHGGTPSGEKPFTLSQFADDLYDFMLELEIEKANILGFSDGGNIALLFALRHPEMVSRLVLNGANLSTSGVKASTQLPIVLGYAICSLISLFDRKAIQKKKMLSLMVGQPRIDPSELRAIKIPVLVLAGTRDLIKEKHSRLIADSLPNSRLVFVKGSHFILRESPGDYNRAVLDFLK